MGPNSGEGLECEVSVDEMRLEYVSEFEYLGCVLDELGTDEAKRRRKAASRRSVVGGWRLQPECTRVLNEEFLVPVLMYGNETMIWKEKERSRIIAVHADNLRGMRGIKRMDGVPNTRMKELCGVTKGVNERNDLGVLRWFEHLERMENKIAKRVYAGQCAGSRSVGWLRKRQIDIMKDSLKKKLYK